MDPQPVHEYSGLAAERFLDSLDRPEKPVALDDEAIRHTLLWLAKQTVAEVSVGMPLAPCATCGHDRYDHAVGGDADNPSPWPCNFPHSRGAPAILCYCGDYRPSGGDEYGYPGGEAT